MRSKSATLVLALGLALSGLASAQVISYSPRTGDVWIDSQLGYVNDYGRGNRDYFVDDVVNSFGAPRYLVNEMLTKRNMSPGDVYYACAMAYAARRPCADVARSYEENRGQGWGVVAKRMGIKPGSAEFHALKNGVGTTNGRYRSRGTTSTATVLRGDDRHDDVRGKAAKGNSKAVHDQDGNDDGKGKNKGKDNGKGKGKDKGH